MDVYYSDPSHLRKAVSNATEQLTNPARFPFTIVFGFIIFYKPFFSLPVQYSIQIFNQSIYMYIVQSNSYRCFLRSRCSPWRLYFLQHYFLLEWRLYLGEHCSTRGHHSLLFVLVGPLLLQSEPLRLDRKKKTIHYWINSGQIFVGFRWLVAPYLPRLCEICLSRGSLGRVLCCEGLGWTELKLGPLGRVLCSEGWGWSGVGWRWVLWVGFSAVRVEGGVG